MPKRTDISSILIIGSGPIVIGQACEFDYSGAQACKALKAEGYRVVLVNSNPATIMTDPEMADATYVEPLTVELLEKIIAEERPDALLPTVGGQTGLNLAVALAEQGILERHGVELIGANLRAMQVAEDRDLFKQAMTEVGLESPRSRIAHSLEEAREIFETVIGRFPIFIRPSFTLGGSGAGTVFTQEEFDEKVAWGLQESPVHTVLVEESLIGWKEYELEVMRDRADNYVVVCSIENLDPMGVHTGDSITVAPSQTLTDKEYQRLRDQARLVMRAVGVETGGSNVQFAVDPESGRVVVIEMNPRVSRSSALASKATGFPIAKLAAKLAVGYTLDELKNDITQETVAAFEPSIDYVVVKIPRWAFEKFPGVDRELGPQMKSVGEVMAIGRTFKEALQKGVRSLEIGRDGLGPLTRDEKGQLKGYAPEATAAELMREPSRDRLFAVFERLLVAEREVSGSRPAEDRQADYEALQECSEIYDPWFVAQMQEIARFQVSIESAGQLDEWTLRQAKRMGFSDAQLARILNEGGKGEERGERREERENGAQLPELSEADVRALRERMGVVPTYHQVDTCAAEFAAFTPYLYSSYESEGEAPPTARDKVIILGGGPNRIGQGIEFDYCCCHASFALQEMEFETVMINCNPETVSTDYDTSDRLYFEPLTLEDVLHIYRREAEGGSQVKVLVQYGGQTPLNLAAGLQAAGVPIIGTQPEAIELAEDRERFSALLAELDIPAPDSGIAHSTGQALAIAARIGYPLVVRPSYVLGGRAMAVVDDEESLRHYMSQAVDVDREMTTSGQEVAILVDQFLEDAYEVDVDAVADGERVVIGGILQHIEEAGIHSGDSACVLPPYKISGYHLSIIREYTEKLGLALGVRGLMNVQYAIKDDVVYVIEVNPRASRTVPFVSKATGVPLAKMAAWVMAGKSLEEVGLLEEPEVRGFFVKEAVLPWKKLSGADTLLGPEMRSTGEVMGHAHNFGHAFAKSQLGAEYRLPTDGGVLITVNDYDKGAALKLARDFSRMGFDLYATSGTAALIQRVGLPVVVLTKAAASEASLLSAGNGAYSTLDAMRDGKIDLIINTPLGPHSRADGQKIRTLATRMEIPLITTLSAAQAAVNGIRAMMAAELNVRSLQAHYARGYS
ncbi:MAG: carbamoyl-phosphate synthase large subunit [Caldilineaceae bacterium SB0670_bin_27]|uniref:Carbamoyl phosphate synthase large chain n=1 Tax=Caldilineaceae bacterium SB0664_bin_27 TaxID=2605260 RepID=A0A6B0YZI6_9CHLR|nr:carbamoyl-phosphate synthase large subunit [Caldilineaceae bacterium SB0664_bin_27]MYJ77559.1 carbamoyl-phosphate synthase large subunit [Caldilineaceae bacterium SB0670_bin_27]